jgi:hypothetical protein
MGFDEMAPPLTVIQQTSAIGSKHRRQGSLDIQIPRELQIDIRFWTTTPENPITPIVLATYEALHALQRPQTRRSKRAEAKKP